MRLAIYLGLTATAAAIWPAPELVEDGTSKTVRLHKQFRIEAPDCSIPQDVRQAIRSAMGHIYEDDMRPLRSDEHQLALQALHAGPPLYLLKLHLPCFGKIPSIAEEVNGPLKDLREKETYELVIPESASEARLFANSTVGLLRGLQTFVQLVYTGHYRQTVRYLLDPPRCIRDMPAFPVRGLLLDTSRHFYPLRVLRRTLIAMSWSKLNIFHWHITDSQSWPLEVESYPDLSRNGAYSERETYKRAEVQALVKFANSIGIQVIVEIDSPGHTASIGATYPDLVACLNCEWQTFAVEPPSGQIRITEPLAVELMTNIIRDTAGILPGQYFGTGGDEVNIACYTEDHITQAALKRRNESLTAALQRFGDATSLAVRDTGKIPVIWEDQAIGSRAIRLNDSSVILAWRGMETLPKLMAMGHHLIYVPYQQAYLDCGRGGWIETGASWCNYVSWWDMYDDPLSTHFPPEMLQDVLLGGMAALWSEQTDSQNVDQILWPRAAVVSELWWTGVARMNASLRNVSDALQRLHDFRYRMVARGVGATPLQPHMCAIFPSRCTKMK